jgi:chlorite dismutase
MTASRTGLLGIVVLAASLLTGEGFAAPDRDKLLNDPGVYGTFAAYRFTDDWARREGATRIALLTVLKGVVEQHREKVVIDLYLLRGLSDHADIMFRVHANDLRDIQRFLVDLQSSAFGKQTQVAGIMHGLSKKANYVPAFPEDIKGNLKAASDPGPKPYVVVIPIRKSAEWWALDQQTRTAMMKEHTEAALPYITTVKRKLYHSTGLDDMDFITYFETSKLEDFHSLILSLEKVKEFQYTRRFGYPTWLGTAIGLDEIIEILAQ